jgi:uncharacterized protein (TIGR02996 family)
MGERFSPRLLVSRFPCLLQMPPPRYEPFLQTVLDHPADDGPRMVYADWLEEQGDPRGEFIRVQLQLNRIAPNDPNFDSLTDREMSLLNRHGELWREEIPEWARNGCEFRRGFVSDVIVWTRWQAGFGPQLSHMTPIEKVTLNEAHDALAEFALSPELPHLRELVILDDGTKPDDLKVLCRSPICRRLRALRFMGMDLLDSGALIIALTPHLRRLQHLEMKRCKIDHRGAVKLGESEYLPGLQWLDLSDNGLGNDAFFAVVNSPLMTHLTRLSWNDNGLTSEAARFLTQSAGVALLSHIDLAGNHLGDRAVHLIRRKFPHLEWLDLSRNPLTAGLQYELKQQYVERVRLGVPGEQ